MSLAHDGEADDFIDDVSPLLFDSNLFVSGGALQVVLAWALCAKEEQRRVPGALGLRVASIATAGMEGPIGALAKYALWALAPVCDVAAVIVARDAAVAALPPAKEVRGEWIWGDSSRRIARMWNAKPPRARDPTLSVDLVGALLERLKGEKAPQVEGDGGG